MKTKIPYIDQCDRLRIFFEDGEKFWQDMMSNKISISSEEIEENCDIARILDEDESFRDLLSLSADSGTYKSIINGNTCYFIYQDGFEFIFGDNKILNMLGKDKRLALESKYKINQPL